MTRWEALRFQISPWLAHEGLKDICLFSSCSTPCVAWRLLLTNPELSLAASIAGGGWDRAPLFLESRDELANAGENLHHEEPPGTGTPR